MKLTSILMVVFILSDFLPITAAAQSKKLTVITTSQKIYKNCKIAILEGNIVELIQGYDYESLKIPVDSLSVIILPGKSNIWYWVGGTAIGAISGVALSPISYQNKRHNGFDELAAGIVWGLGGAAAGFVIGGIIRTSSRDEIRYDLSQDSSEEKVRKLLILIVE